MKPVRPVIDSTMLTATAFVAVLCVFMGLSGSVQAQNVQIRPELEGYQNCGSSDETVLCLENTLASIDLDKGFYTSLTNDRRVKIKSEYCLQLAYAYFKLGNQKKALYYFEQAKMSTDEMIAGALDPERVGLLEDLMIEGLSDLSRNSGTDISKVCDSLIQKIQHKSGGTVESTAVSHPESELNRSLLETLRAYLLKNPISSQFTAKNASDSCVLEIRKSTNSEESVLDCYLTHSKYIDLVGIRLMGVAKAIKYDPNKVEDHMVMTIVVRPDKSDDVVLHNGIFYVNYRSERLIVAENIVVTLQEGPDSQTEELKDEKNDLSETSNMQDGAGEEHDVSDMSEATDADNELNSSLLETLKDYLASNPISPQFISKNASDSCILEIRRSVDSEESVLDCSLKHSKYIDLVGINLMGIAKAIKYDTRSAEDRVAMTIVIRPNDSDDIVLNDGIFYVYYKSDGALGADPPLTTARSGPQ